MAKLLLKSARYLKGYGELTFGSRPRTPEEAIDGCVDRTILKARVRSEFVEPGKLLRRVAPKRSLEIGANHGGTLFLLCTVSAPVAQIIDPGGGSLGGGPTRRKTPRYRKFTRNGRKLRLIRTDSHFPEEFEAQHG